MTAPYRAHMGSVMGMEFSPDGTTLATAGTLGSAQLTPLSLWDLSGHRLNGTAAHLTITIRAKWDGSDLIVTSGTDGKVRMWDSRLLQVGYDLASHTEIATSIAVSKDGFVATGGGDGFIQIHDLRDSTLLDKLEKSVQ